LDNLGELDELKFGFEKMRMQWRGKKGFVGKKIYI
jgi:hypothetical protein